MISKQNITHLWLGVGLKQFLRCEMGEEKSNSRNKKKSFIIKKQSPCLSFHGVQLLFCRNTNKTSHKSKAKLDESSL